MAIGLATGLIAGIGAATSVAGGIAGAHAAKSAAQTAADASLEGTKLSVASNEKMYNQTRSDQLPYLTGGAGALGRLDYLLGLPGPQTTTKGAYAAGYGPQGTAYLPGTGGVPAQGAAPTSSAAYGPQAGVGTFQGRESKLNPYDGRGNYPLDDRASMNFAASGGKGTSGAAPQAPVPGVVDPSYGSLMKDFSASDFQTDPGYEFRLSEGQKALDRSAAARGGLFSGETLKANDQYNQNFASNEYQNAYNRFQQNRTTKYNFLSNAAGGGQTSAAELGRVGAQYANNIGNAYMTGYGNAANARASGYIGAANSWNGALTGVNNALGRI